MCESCKSLVGCQPHLCAIQKAQLASSPEVILTKAARAKNVTRTSAAGKSPREYAAELMALASA
jgi:hypothetical protein